MEDSFWIPLSKTSPTWAKRKLMALGKAHGWVELLMQLYEVCTVWVPKDSFNQCMFAPKIFRNNLLFPSSRLIYRSLWFEHGLSVTPYGPPFFPWIPAKAPQGFIIILIMPAIIFPFLGILFIKWRHGTTFGRIYCTRGDDEIWHVHTIENMWLSLLHTIPQQFARK